MQKYITIRTVLILILPALLGFAAFQLLDADSPDKDDHSELDRLFEAMYVLKVPHADEPVEVRLNDTSGREISLSDFKGKIVFLNFWTTWCPTCRIEMPSMVKLHQKLKQRDFAMVTINLRESALQVQEFFKSYKLTFTALLDSTGEVGAMFGIFQIPTTYILDKDGRIIGKAVGPREWDSKKSIALFEHLIDSYAAVSGLK